MLMLMPVQQRLAALAARELHCESNPECEPGDERSVAAKLSGILRRRFFKISILTKC